MPKVRVNGVSLHYNVFGKGKETIIFSHGLLFDNTMFHNQIDFFKSRYRCIAYDHRGQGNSERTKQGYDMDNLTQDCLGLMDALGIEKCHFVGMAMGGFVAMRIAARHPERIKSLILLGTSANADNQSSKFKMMAWMVRIFGVKPIVKRVVRTLFGEKFLKDVNRRKELLKWYTHLESHRKSILRAALGVIKRQSILHELPRITAPTLIITGDQDAAIEPIHTQQAHEKISNSQFIMIGGAGHTSVIEEPEQINQVMEVFLKTL